MAGAEGKIYEPYSGIIKGSDGADPVLLSVANGTGGTMACTAALAHWYSEDLGKVGAGATLDVTLWHDPDTGVINLLNQTDDRMPVEAIWCGAAGDLTATRARITLPIAAGPLPAQLVRDCARGSDGRFACVEADG